MAAMLKPPSEDTICRSFIQCIEYHVAAGTLDRYDVIHVNNGEHSGDKRQRMIAGAKAKALGQRKGVADYLVCGRQSKEQKEFEAWAKERGMRYEIFSDWRDGVDAVLREARRG